MAAVKFTSIQNASVLRKFTVLFILMSVIPIGILYYFYIQLKEQGRIEITGDNLAITLFWTILGVITGYVAMRAVLKNIIDITKTNKETLQEVLGSDKIKEITENNNEIAVLARSFNEIIHRLEENIKNLEAAKRTLHSVLSRVGAGISSMQNIDNFLELIVETVAKALSAKVGVLMLLDDFQKEFYVKTLYGVNDKTVRELRLKPEEGPFTSVLKTRKPLSIPKLKEMEFLKPKEGPLFEAPLICAPLLVHEKILGVITMSGKEKEENFQEEELGLLYNLALQTGVAVENARLNEDAEKTYFETISALALAVEAKDQYSRGHLDRVADYAMRIARKLNVSEEDIKTLRDSARLHDLGKIGILDEVLRKPGPLNEQEWAMMRKHPEIGESIIKPIRSLSKLCDVIRHHHEKLDGSGYPDGLKGDQISLLARILGVADIFDALTTDRPYRKAFSIEEAKKELLKMMEGHLDCKVVNALLETI